MADEKLVGRAVFGAFDGATSLVGVLAGLVAAHAAAGTILATCAGLAVASSVGMAFGDHLAGASRSQATVMGAATLVGSILPALPVAMLYGPVGYLLSGLSLVVLAIAIAEARPGPRGSAYLTTFGTLLIASLLSAAAALLFGASA